MNSSFSLSDDQLMEGFGAKLAFLVDSLDLSQPARDLLVEIILAMEPSEVVKFAAMLEEKLAAEQSDVLEIILQNKLDALAVQQIEESNKIDQKTTDELIKMIQDLELASVRQDINKV